MSWDIFVQDLPRDARTTADIPDDFTPQPLGPRAQIIQRIKEVEPLADSSDVSWGNIEAPNFGIEISLGSNEELSSFAFHVRGDGVAARAVVQKILQHLDLRACDPDSESGFFELEE